MNKAYHLPNTTQEAAAIGIVQSCRLVIGELHKGMLNHSIEINQPTASCLVMPDGIWVTPPLLRTLFAQTHDADSLPPGAWRQVPNLLTTLASVDDRFQATQHNTEQRIAIRKPGQLRWQYITLLRSFFFNQALLLEFGFQPGTLAALLREPQ
ncbi:MAG TPA: hypothetical protein PLE99_05820 [Candidatus Thiothrix moscowensis]|uniref:hypothetical protein n=1 Tax=unclassified Thiothrix TaxID=2636184 RepID=UPI0025D50694|nr:MULTISPECIES: hypothetical protein [unclassified Thiothrix]HRJ52262.1 hypothetical protein [Candidatus Thiothrix moscowensis]HRJ92577.1 hypothetical protein [Candidatus Thiothrix moscowensis]